MAQQSALEAAPAPRRAAFEAWLTKAWWQPRPGPLAWALWAPSLLYRSLATLARWLAKPPEPTAVPVVVVGNLVVGGAGKTPLVIALVQALARAGHRPGVISRGHGRHGDGVRAVARTATAHDVGDEPLLIQRRTGAPVFVGPQRVLALQALLAAHPGVDVVISDDGLQHHALARVAEWIVFDDRGTGNGLCLPAGPLRQPLPLAAPASTRVVYSGSRISTPLPGVLVPRRAEHAILITDWARGDAGASRPLHTLRGRRLTALAGIGAPEAFFAMLEAAGLTIDRLPCPDHAEYLQEPWAAGTAEVITTEKDAVKLVALLPTAMPTSMPTSMRPASATPVWVLPLDCELPADLLRDLLARLAGPIAGKGLGIDVATAQRESKR